MTQKDLKNFEISFLQARQMPGQQQLPPHCLEAAACCLPITDQTTSILLCYCAVQCIFSSTVVQYSVVQHSVYPTMN